METMTSPIAIERTGNSRLREIDFNNLEFGKHISDHMIVADWNKGGWSDPKVVPYGELRMSPSILALHYGQAVFEGMKAFHMKDGTINIFRPQKHHDRFNKSLVRMCMPTIPYEMFMMSLRALIEVDKDWVPTGEGSALYIRPLVFASEARLGVKVSDQYKFVILTSPVGPYYSKPLRLKIEEHFTRTAEGGTGFAKCAGNYGGAFYPTQLAKQEGFDQVLWTDHKEHQYVDEVGMMNVMFVLDGTLVTPELNSAILDGVTRDSILKIAKEMGLKVEERRVSLDELEQAFINKSITEAFGAGTAAVVAPVAIINFHGTDHHLPPIDAGSIQLKMKHALLEIRTGAKPDTHGWNCIVRV